MGGGEYPQMYPHSGQGSPGRVGERLGGVMPDNVHISTCRISSGEPLRISDLDRKPGSYATGLSGYENIGTNIMIS